MMDDRNALFSQQTFARAIEVIWREAEMLDRRDYRAWLDLWDASGFYVVPIDPQATDFAATLNYAYDDQHMRELRVQRMTSGYSASASDAARTVRTVSRFTLTSESALTREPVFANRSLAACETSISDPGRYLGVTVDTACEYEIGIVVPPHDSGKSLSSATLAARAQLTELTRDPTCVSSEWKNGSTCE